MVFKSRRPQLVFPRKDILSFMFDDWKHGWDRPLFIEAENPSKLFTAGQVLSLLKRVGRGLRESAGIKNGDVVLLSATNSIIIPPVMLGILCAGAIFSGSNPNSTESELSYQINDTGAKAIFAVEETLENVLRCVKTLGLPTSMVYLISLEKGHSSGVRTLGDLLQYGEMEWERMSTEEEMHNRVAALNYSSGTTGLPKGCMISVFNVVAHCAQQRQVRDIGYKAAGLPNNDTLLAFLPFYHAFGQQHYVFNATRNGDTTYVMKSFSLSALLEYIPRYRITTFAAAPPVIVLLAKNPSVRQTDFSSLHAITCGAAPLGADTQLQAEEAMNAFKKGQARITQGWGMSEGVCGSCIFAMHERDPDISGVGYLLADMSAKIVPADDEQLASVGEEGLGWNREGEVLLKGPQIFKGYWKKEKQTKEAFTADGWYKTGDIGVMRRDGILHIVDRKKELIKVKGFQVAPAELEDLLLKSSDVEDVAVIGIQGEGTEYPRAYIVPTPSRRSSDPQALQKLADDITKYVATRLAKYKHLMGGVVFVDAIPKNPSGKILRRQLRDAAKGVDVKVWVSEDGRKARAKL